MDDALLVRGFECIGDLLRDRDGFVERKRTACDPIGERRRPSTSSSTSALIGSLKTRRRTPRSRRSRRCADD